MCPSVPCAHSNTGLCKRIASHRPSWWSLEGWEVQTSVFCHFKQFQVDVGLYFNNLEIMPEMDFNKYQQIFQRNSWNKAMSSHHIIYIWGAVEIYYNCLVCFWKVIGFWGGPYRFTGFCCIWHHHEILVCSDIKNCMKEAMEIADKKEDEIRLLWYWKHGAAEGSFTAKKWFGHRAGRCCVGSHSQRRIQATRLSVLIGRMQWTCLWRLQNAVWACSEQALGSSILTIFASVLSGHEISADGYR